MTQKRKQNVNDDANLLIILKKRMASVLKDFESLYGNLTAEITSLIGKVERTKNDDTRKQGINSFLFFDMTLEISRIFLTPFFRRRK